MTQNPPELTTICGSVAQRSSRLLADFAQKQAASLSSAVRDEMGIARAFMDLYSRMAADPALLANTSMSMWADYMRLWQSTWLKMLGLDAPPVAEPAAGDARFKDEDWSSNFVFDHIKQSYLIAARHIQQVERCRDIGNGLGPDRVVRDQQRRQLGDLREALADGRCIGVGEASCDAGRTQRPGSMRCDARQGLGEFEGF